MSTFLQIETVKYLSIQHLVLGGKSITLAFYSCACISLVLLLTFPHSSNLYPEFDFCQYLAYLYTFVI